MKRLFILGLFISLFGICAYKLSKEVIKLLNDSKYKKILSDISNEKECSIGRAINYYAVKVARESMQIDMDQLDVFGNVITRDNRVSINTEFGTIRGYVVGFRNSECKGYGPVIIITDTLKLHIIHTNNILEEEIFVYGE